MYFKSTILKSAIDSYSYSEIYSEVKLQRSEKTVESFCKALKKKFLLLWDTCTRGVQAKLGIDTTQEVSFSI